MAEMKLRHVGATLALMAALFWNPFTSPLNAQSAVGGKSAAIEVLPPEEREHFVTGRQLIHSREPESQGLTMIVRPGHIG